MRNKFIILSVIVVVGVAAYFLWGSEFKKQTPSLDSTDRVTEVSTSENSSECTDLKFTHHFTDVNTITSIVPPVFVNSRGSMPTTLINIQGKAPLYMPTSGKPTQGSYHTEEGTEFYLLEIDVGCGVTVVFDHVTEPVDKIKNLFPDTPTNDSRTDDPFFNTTLELTAGELVGYTTGSTFAHNWNFAVYDASERNYLWEREDLRQLPKYYMQVCPLKYYDESIAQIYEELFIFSSNDIYVEKNLCAP